MKKTEQCIVGRRTAVAGSLAVGALAALAGCSGKNNATDTAKDKAKTDAVLNVVLRSNPRCIDPYNANERMGHTVVSCLFDALTEYDYKTAQLKPRACTSWEMNDQGDLFTFHLVPNAKFHNGEVVDAQAFKRAWERIVNPKTGNSPSNLNSHLSCVDGYQDLFTGKTSELRGVTCPDANTLVVKLSTPFTDFPYVVSYRPLGPVPKAALENPSGFFRAPIGNGPFKMDGTWEDGQYIRVKRFDDYYGNKASLAGIYFRIIKDERTIFNEFMAGNLDLIDVPINEIEKIESSYGTSDDGYTITPGKRFISTGGCSTKYILFNLNDPIMSNVNVRRALSLTINRETICDVIYRGKAKQADNIIPPHIKGYQKDVWKDARYDFDEAERLLDIDYPGDASGKRDLTITFSCHTLDDGPEAKARYETIAGDWEKLGITVKIEFKEWAAFLDEVDKGKYQVGYINWTADYPTMDNFLYSLFYTGVSNNASRYSNPAVDKLIFDARSVTDETKRIAMLSEANALIAEDVCVAPVMFDDMCRVGSKRIKYLYENPEGIIDWKSIELTE